MTHGPLSIQFLAYKMGRTPSLEGFRGCLIKGKVKIRNAWQKDGSPPVPFLEIWLTYFSFLSLLLRLLTYQWILIPLNLIWTPHNRVLHHLSSHQLPNHKFTGSPPLLPPLPPRSAITTTVISPIKTTYATLWTPNLKMATILHKHHHRKQPSPLLAQGSPPLISVSAISNPFLTVTPSPKTIYNPIFRLQNLCLGGSDWTTNSLLKILTIEIAVVVIDKDDTPAVNAEQMIVVKGGRR